MGDRYGNPKGLLVMLSATFALSHLDRHILNITLNEISIEFDLSDLQLGALSGFSFALIYVLFGFPIARFARAGRRKFIVISALTIWSLMTMAMGAATNYLTLLLARAGIGLGEAGCTPPSHAMIADSWPPEKRAAALAFFAAGSNVGVFLAFLVGGIVAAAWGWRVAFFMAAVPGLLLAAFMLWRLKEPPATATVLPGSYRTVVKTIWRNRSTRHAVIGAALTAMIGYGALAWLSVFLVRTHGLSLPQIGLYLAIVIGVLGAVGTWSGGFLSDWFGKHDERLKLKTVAVSIVIVKAFAVVFYLTDNTALALASFVIPGAFGAFFAGPTFSHVYARVAPADRPLATAILLFSINLVGFGLGPVLVGAGSDALVPLLGDDALRWCLVLVQLAALWGAFHFWLAGASALQTSEITPDIANPALSDTAKSDAPTAP